jgi:Uma2 family endonuclease
MTQAGTIPAARRPMPERMTYAEFLAYPHGNQHVEWIDGRVVAMPAVTDRHSDLTLFLGAILRSFTDARGLGVVRGDPFNMKVGPDLPGRQPDLLFLSASHLHRLHPSHLDGPADFVVEVISTGSRRVDRVEKFQEYERGGVREYLLIDPDRATAELYRLTGGRYEEVLPDPQDVLRTETMPGFFIRTAWVTRWPLPSVPSILKELGVA